MDSLRSSAFTPSQSSHSPVKELPARAESIGFVFATTTLTVTAVASPGVHLSSNVPLSSTHASFMLSSSTVSNSALSSTASSSLTKSKSTSRPPETTDSAVSDSECSSSKAVLTPIIVVLITIAVVAVMLSLAICCVRSRKLCRKCKAVVFSQSLSKQTPPTHDYGSQPLSKRNYQSGMATSASSLNTQVARFHTSDVEQGNPHPKPCEYNVPFNPQIATMAPRIPQTNWEHPKPDLVNFHASLSTSSGEVRRGHSSISIASIIDKYAQVPDQNRHRTTFQYSKANGVAGSLQNIRCGGNPLVDLRSGTLRCRLVDDGRAVGRDSISPNPAWKHLRLNGTEDAANSLSLPPIESYTEARERQQRQLEMGKIGRSGSVSGDGRPYIVQYKGLCVHALKHAKQERQSESSYNPIVSSRASQPSSMTSSTSRWPERGGNFCDHVAPDGIAGPSRPSHAPSDATQDSEDNISRMLKRWAFLDQQNIRPVDRALTRSSSARDRLNGPLNSRLKPHALNVRRSTSTPLPGSLSTSSFSGVRRAKKAENGESKASESFRNKMALSDQTVGSTHDENCNTTNQYRETPLVEANSCHSHDGGFSRPYFQQRTYSDSLYSRPTTLQLAPDDCQAVNDKYFGQWYSSPQLYGPQFYGSSEAGPSQPTRVTSFLNEDYDNTSSDPLAGCEYRYGELDCREQLSRRRANELSLSERGTIRDNAPRRHMRDMRAVAADGLLDSETTARQCDAGGPGDSRRRSSFIRGFVGIYGGVGKKNVKKPVVGDNHKRSSIFLDVKRFLHY